MARLQGARVGLITNQTALDPNLRHAIDLLRQSGIVELQALFGPEHGVRGDAQAGEMVVSSTDESSGLPVVSLYGEQQAPRLADLEGLDALLFDIQDIGIRYVTYATTMLACLRATAKAGISLVVLDRPNPLNGQTVEGNLPDPSFSSFVASMPVPVRHGLTMGELARCCQDVFEIAGDLIVVPMEGWRRGWWFDRTGRYWVPPSPNLPTLEAAAVYPGTCLLEGASLSEGRGTTKPFEVFGAPWIDPARLRLELDKRSLPGVAFRETWFTPVFSKHAGERCGGLQIHVSNRRALKPVLLGVHILDATRSLWPDQMLWTGDDPDQPWIDCLFATDGLRLALDAGVAPGEIARHWEPDERRFRRERRAWMLYD